MRKIVRTLERYICSLAKAVNYIIIAMLLNLELGVCIVAITTEKKNFKKIKERKKEERENSK